MSTVQMEYGLTQELEMLWSKCLEEDENSETIKVESSISSVVEKDIELVSAQQEDDTFSQVNLNLNNEVTKIKMPEEKHHEESSTLYPDLVEENEITFEDQDFHDVSMEGDARLGEKEIQVNSESSVIKGCQRSPEVKATLKDMCANKDNSFYTAASASGEFLFEAKTAEEVLGNAISQIYEGLDGRTPFAISVLGDHVSSVHGIRLQAYITAVILNAIETTPKFVILVIENFTQEQIIDLYEHDFIEMTLNDQPRLAHIIFLSPSYQNVKHFSGTRKIGIESGSQAGKILGNDLDIESEDDIDDEYGNSATLSARRKDTPTPYAFHMDEALESRVPLIKSPSVSTAGRSWNYEMTTGISQNAYFSEDTDEHNQEFKKNEYSIPTGASLPGSSTKLKENGRLFEYETKNEGNRHATCFGCFLGIYYFIGDMIAQCGDCCFY